MEDLDPGICKALQDIGRIRIIVIPPFALGKGRKDFFIQGQDKLPELLQAHKGGQVVPQEDTRVILRAHGLLHGLQIGGAEIQGLACQLLDKIRILY